MKFALHRIARIPVLLFLVSCSANHNRVNVDVGHVDVGEVRINRYEEAIFNLDTAHLQQELKRIKPTFPIFLDGDLDDPETLEKMAGFISDQQLIEAFHECQVVFEDIGWLEKELTALFRHLKYYFPDQAIPSVYTYVSGYDFEFRTQFYNNNLLIAIDMYLGPDHSVYQKLGVPQYVIRKFQPSYITRDVAFEIGSEKINYRNPGNDLLGFMINEGKLLWFIRAMIPGIQEEILFDYTGEQLAWVKQNEGLVWAFMIENEALYSSEPDFKKKFILESPFTSYFGQDSPPRLGAYIGFRIVDSYMQKNRDITPESLMLEMNATGILKESRYKPEL